MKQILEKLHIDMTSDGAYVLQRPSRAAEQFMQLHGPKEYKYQLRDYYTTLKLIKQQDEVIIVSMTFEAWGGITVYPAADVVLTEENGELFLKLNQGRERKLLSIIDYSDGTLWEEEIDGVSRVCAHADDEYYEKLFASGYVTKKEYEHYVDPDVRATLPQITQVKIHKTIKEIMLERQKKKQG